MWNRARYDRGKMRYPSDVTDEEWALVEPHIPPARRGGGKRTVVMREVVNGLMYVLSTGCQWAAIPEDLPPKSTVYDYFDLWSWDGTLDRIHEALYVRQPGLSRSWLPIRQKSDCRISFEVADQRAVSCVAKPSHRCRQSQAEDRSEAPAADETARRLTSIPGVGPLIAATVRATINDSRASKPEETSPLGSVSRRACCPAAEKRSSGRSPNRAIASSGPYWSSAPRQSLSKRSAASLYPRGWPDCWRESHKSWSQCRSRAC